MPIADAVVAIPPLALHVRWQVVDLHERFVRNVEVLKCRGQASAGPGARHHVEVKSGVCRFRPGA